MCLAIYQPVGVKIARERLSNGWDNNPDGGGYAFIDENGQIQVRKFLLWTEFIRGYERDHAANTKSPFIIHERFATHGSKDLFGVHPFEVDEHTVVIHNGILDVLMRDDKRSDTRTFVEDYLTKLPMNWMDDVHMFHMVEEFIGLSNKLVILTSDPYASQSVYILNEKRGHWDRAAWWSNDGYKPRWASQKWRNHPSATGSKGAGGVMVANPTKGPVNQKKPDNPVQSVSAGGLVEAGSLSDWDDDWDTLFPPKTYRDYRDQCWLCGEVCDHPPVCFRCEWCTEHSQEWWTCPHVEDVELVQAYVRYYSDMTMEEREVHDEYVLEATTSALWVVEDEQVEAALEKVQDIIETDARIRRA